MAFTSMQTAYSIEENTILQGLLEQTEGTTSTGTYITMPIYDAFNPMQHQQATQELNRAKNSLATDGTFLLEAMKAIRFKTFVYNAAVTAYDPGNGTSITVPPWASILLPASGFWQSSQTEAAPTISSATVVEAATGALANGAYKYTWSKVNQDEFDKDGTAPDENDRQETLADETGKTVTTVGGFGVTVTHHAAAGAGYVWRLYRTKAGQNTFYYHSDRASAETSFLDTVADTALDMTRTAPVTATAGEVFTPMNRDFYSMTFKAYLDSQLQIANGARGNWNGSFEAGRPFEMNWEFTGAHVAATGDDNPAGTCVGPGLPPRIEGATAVLIPTTNGAGVTTSTGGSGVAISPFIVKSGTFTPGTRTAMRRDINSANGGVKSVGIHQQFQARISYVLEVDRAFGWDPVADFRAGVQFGTKFTVGSGANGRVEFSAPNIRIVDAPELTREDEGIRCWRVTFGCLNLGNCNDWMQIKFY